MKHVLAAITEGLQVCPSVDGRRLFHGRGQCYEGLGAINVDWFPPLLFITLYQQPEPEAWQQLLQGLQTLQGSMDCAMVQRRYLRGAPTEVVFGAVIDQPVVHEQGLQFALSFGAKQNIGFFMDMSPGRDWLRQRSKGKRVLNLFSYSCSFSVAAIAGQAKDVLNVDMSRAALNVGRKNHQLNGHDAQLKRDIQFLSHDIFRSWKKIIGKGPYDIVIIDPPSRQKGGFIAEKDYARVIRRLESLMPEGGDILACLNAPHLPEAFLLESFSRECPQAKFIERLANREDYPERDNARNLKMLHYRLLI